MCTSTPKAPKAPAPPPMPESNDDAAMREGDRERKRASSKYGRASTILTSGNTGSATTTGKTLLGS